MHPKQRQHYHSALLAWFEGSCEARAAATVAGLVGSCSADEVVQLAGRRFRHIELAALRQEDLADNSPNPTLYTKSCPGRLNVCDAFISHSWHDDAGAKWAALQSWRQRFVAEHGREPNVWIDKCCLDQNNIEEDLRCLPIFLGGCRKMVVFCGPTYLQRLWCIIEVFTFVHMGRNVANLEVEVVLCTESEDEDRIAIRRCLESFDAERCSCFDAGDKARMLNIIYASFGNISAFNRAVRDILLHTVKLREAVCERARSSSEFSASTTAVGRMRPHTPSQADLHEMEFVV